MPHNTLYDQDFYAWANEQAALLRGGKLAQADIAHIAEEIERLGKIEKRELISLLAVLLLHLLKWRFQPTLRGKRWRLSVEEQRIQLALHLGDNPSLKNVLAPAIANSYPLACIGAERETGLDAATFPIECPWSFDQMMNSDFWPE